MPEIAEVLVKTWWAGESAIQDLLCRCARTKGSNQRGQWRLKERRAVCPSEPFLKRGAQRGFHGRSGGSHLSACRSSEFHSQDTVSYRGASYCMDPSVSVAEGFKRH